MYVCMYVCVYIYHLLSQLSEYVVAQVVEALCYKPEGHRSHSSWGHWDFSLT